MPQTTTTTNDTIATRKAPANYSQEEGRALDLVCWTLVGIKTACPVERSAIKSALQAIKAVTAKTAEQRRCACNRAGRWHLITPCKPRLRNLRSKSPNRTKRANKSTLCRLSAPCLGAFLCPLASPVRPAALSPSLPLPRPHPAPRYHTPAPATPKPATPHGDPSNALSPSLPTYLFRQSFPSIPQSEAL
ncbi:hypothetical protein UFOVP157_26 [uncultured Caudovirales phage]|uniref:Uncharacterized protein n=1 Tax=uncultured Caudovirales phage TaxID=2100421 RepID=A0A6J7WCL6_9CAUD|nr:hypothetical protein UFOVP157_26 [uncultured Caudovirales phage]